MSDNIINPEEYDLFVGNLREFQVIDVGSLRWIESHEMLLKLNQQAVLEATTYRDETIKELLVMSDKLPILIHEAFCILIWRLKVVPKIFELNVNPSATFILYTALYHEAIAISLLELVLYHENGCVALGESAVDLIDYCAQALVQLIAQVNNRRDANMTDDELRPHNGSGRDASVEFERQQHDLLHAIGMRCLTILSYLADKVNALPAYVARRMVQTHDIPCLLSQILHDRPWQRNMKRLEKFIDDKWTPVCGGDILQITKYEAQTWFCLRQLLMNTNVIQHYNINEFRQRELSKCQVLLTVHVLDQLPVLGEFKHFLCTLQITHGRERSGCIYLEEMPVIRDRLQANAKKIGYRQIAIRHNEEYLNLDHNGVVEMARRLNDAYNMDFLAQMEINNEQQQQQQQQTCGKCRAPAEKKCSRCEQVYYCSRTCQVKHWPVHKPYCATPPPNAFIPETHTNTQ